VIVFAPSSEDATPEPASAIDPSAGELVRDDSPQDGPADAPVTVVEFMDPECESCRAMAPIVEQIRDEYAGRIRFVVRYFPLHYNSALAAQAIEAAGRQGKYWEMYAYMFAQQPQWGEQRTSQRAAFLEYARELGLDTSRFEADIDDPILAAKVERDREDGLANAVDGTPTFFVNGQMVGYMMTFEQFKSRIDTALAQP